MRADIVAIAIIIYRLMTGDYDTLIDRLPRTVEEVEKLEHTTVRQSSLLSFILPLLEADGTYQKSLSDIILDFEKRFRISPGLKKNYLENTLYYTSK